MKKMTSREKLDLATYMHTFLKNRSNYAEESFKELYKEHMDKIEKKLVPLTMEASRNPEMTLEQFKKIYLTSKI